jgi:hypothetical protein
MILAHRIGRSRRLQAGTGMRGALRKGLVFAVCSLVAVEVFGQTGEQSEDVVRAEAPIVAGNAVSAKKRALADAFRQAVERAFAEVIKGSEPLPQPWPAAVAQLKASFASAAQRFVRSYRLIEESSEGGVFKVMVEADVDTVLLRRDLDRARGSAAAAAPPVAPKAASVVLVAGVPGATVAVVRAVTAEGALAQAEGAQSEAQLVASAAKRNAHALFVTEQVQDEGAVRGTLQVSVQCSLAAHLFLAGRPTGRPALDEVHQDRGFGANQAAAREACVDRTATLLARAIVAKLRMSATAASFVTLQIDIVDPGAVSLILRACRRMGFVTATEVRQVTANSAELRVFTRMGGPALQQALTRELAGKLAIVPTQVGDSGLALRVRNPDSSALEENR